MALHQVLCVCIIVSSLGYLYDSWVCEKVDLGYIYLFLSSFPSVGLPCPIQGDLFFVLSYYYVLCSMFYLKIKRISNLIHTTISKLNPMDNQVTFLIISRTHY